MSRTSVRVAFRSAFRAIRYPRQAPRAWADSADPAAEALLADRVGAESSSSSPDRPEVKAVLMKLIGQPELLGHTKRIERMKRLLLPAFAALLLTIPSSVL